MPKGRVPYPFGKCTVCSDQATGNHYGAVTCEGCKGFFKRSLGKSHTYRCRGSYNCSVGTDNRIKCKACRFKRCKELGMSMSAIKMGRIPKAEKLRALESAYGDLGAAAAAIAAGSLASVVGSVAMSDRPTSAVKSADGGDRSLDSFESRHVGEEVAASLSRAMLDSPDLAGGADSGCELHSAADPTIEPAAASLSDSEADCDDAFDTVLDLSSRASGHTSRQGSSRRVAARGGAQPMAGAMRQLTMVNSLIAKHVRAMDGAASGDRPTAENAGNDLSQTEVFSATATASPTEFNLADAATLQHLESAVSSSSSSSRGLPPPPLPLNLAGRRQGLPPASAAASCLTLGGIKSHVRATTQCSSSSSGQNSTDLSFGSQDGLAVPSFVTAAPTVVASAAEPLPNKTLSETVQAVSSAYLKMSAATRRCIDVMSRRVAAGGQQEADLSITGDNQCYALEQVMIGFDLLGNKLMGFIKSCPGLSALWTEDVLALAKRAYLSIWLVLESPLFRDGESHMLLPNGRRHTRSWMRLYLPDVLVERMHAYARAQVAARLTVPELGLMCGLLLTSCRRNQSLSDEAAVTRLNSIFAQALSYEVHRGRLHPHRILANIWHLLAILQDVNDSHEALARGCGGSSSAGAAAQPQTGAC